MSDKKEVKNTKKANKAAAKAKNAEQKKNVKKPNGAAAGFVVYYTNYSLTIHPDISDIRQIE